MIKASISISTRGLHVYANGFCKVFLRLYIGRKSNYYEIPHVEFLSQNWDKNNKKVKNRTPDYADINLQISHFYNLANGILRRYSRENRNITFDSFEMELYNKGYETDFFDYAKKHIAKYDNKSTADKIEDTISKLKQFTKSEILSFGEIDDKLLLKFKNWCMTVKNNKDITATRGLGIIRTIFNSAIQDGIITDNPVKKIKLDSFEGKRNAITLEAFRYLLQYLKTEKINSTHKNSISAFLFACCCGLRWSDIQKMRFKDLKGNILEVTEKKTKKFRQISIMPDALSLINFLNKKSDEQTIFKLSQTSSPTNNILKDIAKAINSKEEREVISPAISFHSSRATFASMVENYTDLYTAARLTGNSPKVAANHYVNKENKEKDKKTLNLIANDFFS
jgi:integrase